MKKVNLEMKHFCDDFGKVRKVLKDIGAKKEVVKEQLDYFFNLPNIKKENNPRLKLRIEDSKKVELIYYERPNFKKGKGSTSDVSLFQTFDKQILSVLERSLGIKVVVEKKREVWRKDNTVFYLDVIKDIGNIFEVELQKDNGIISERDKKLFEDYQKKLLPVIGKVVNGSNVDLVLRK
ncbi:MAG: CYTH domain-containing protein [Candidatus Paceibacterota bacterium]|jgi:adenylate cyclase class IV